jgi:succinyl-CoA synthetase alpha subunit
LVFKFEFKFVFYKYCNKVVLLKVKGVTLLKMLQRLLANPCQICYMVSEGIGNHLTVEVTGSSLQKHVFIIGLPICSGHLAEGIDWPLAGGIIFL